MATYYTTRNAQQPIVANVDNPAGTGPWQFVSLVYASVTGAQDWILMPDGGQVGIQLINKAAGTAILEYTNSPPSQVLAGTAEVVQQTGATVSTRYEPTGVTAVRVNITSGNWTLQVRC